MLFKKNFLLAILLLIITFTSYEWYESLGLTGISMLYLLFVVGVAYHYSKYQTVVVAFASFLIINYLFIEPKFTFQVGNAASWASLISFLIVSVVITSLVKRLKIETLQSKQAYLRAEFLRKISEKLSYSDTIQGLLEDCQALLEKEFGSTVLIVKDGVPILDNYALTSEQFNAIAWVQANGKSFGVGTNNWADANFVIFPFNRLQSHDPVVLIPQTFSLEHTHLLENIKLAVVHIAVAYQHLLQKERTLAAENQAREEAIRSALLASIAHDMRTPLTSILGAATTLNQPGISFNDHEMQHLTNIISSQAKHLARTTENILSLVRLESVSKETICMEVQSPEEMVGALVNLYQYQTDAPPLSIQVNQADILINANHDLVVLALANLVENAKQANIDNNCPDATIHIVVGEAEDKVFIQVCDSGRGFADGFNVDHIKKFESSRNKGFGLGLSIVDAVAKLHQATLIFEKVEKHGAKVSLIFRKPNIDIDHVK